MSDDESIDLVKRFLRAMEARDLATAGAMMAPGARITFPGGKIFGSQAEMVDASRGRYQWVKKRIDLADSLPMDDTQVVYVMGTLYGVNRHGISFSGIRFIERFVVKDYLITRQDVWNDLAESSVLDR